MLVTSPHYTLSYSRFYLGFAHVKMNEVNRHKGKGMWPHFTKVRE